MNDERKESKISFGKRILELWDEFKLNLKHDVKILRQQLQWYTLGCN